MSGVKDAEPTLDTLKKWVVTVKKLVTGRTPAAPKGQSQTDVPNIPQDMKYVAGNLEDMKKELEKHAVNDPDWEYYNLVGKFRQIMKAQEAIEANSAKQTLDSLQPALDIALSLVAGSANDIMDTPKPDDPQYLVNSIKYIAAAVTSINDRCLEDPIPANQPWDNYTLRGKVKLISNDRKQKEEELKSLRIAYQKLQKDLAQKAG